ncbi:MAG: oxygen-independent coproporphyrinogen III oxidase [Gammaproteobacteria bacterium]|nr:oxygen-independent coproporphyrinogen III oxidase [Gammaproteobacteria bacterium]
MIQPVIFDESLIRRYDQSGPRYTSYPTAAQFHAGISEDDYRRWAKHSNEDPIPRALSLYFHIPFCDTVCFYCACTKVVTKDHSRAARYIDYLGKELELQAPLFDRDRHVAQLHWGGGTPTFLNNEEIRRLMDMTRQHFSLLSDDSGEYSIEIDPRSVDDLKLKVLREVGFNRISLGVQDFNPDIQKAVNRIQDLTITLGVLNSARALGYKSINMDLIYGLPLQTTETFSETLRSTIDMGPDRIAVYNYAHLPTRFKPQRRINEADLPSPQTRLDILQKTIELLTDAGYVYIGMDHFARPDDELAIAQENGTLHRNFQGYSTHSDCDLVAIGMSAIGHVCDNYNQNVRDLEQYYALLDQGKLPLDRGIELEPDDLLRREIITLLICHFKLDISALEKKWNFSFARRFENELAELEKMQDDGLLSLDKEMIRVQPAGRLLVRNICMVFDRYLKGNKGSYTFSKVI